MILSPARAELHDLPGSFPALMDLYERNYISIRRLLPVMPPTAAVRVSHTPSGLSLHLYIVERCRYTSDLILTYRFYHDADPPTSEPDLHIRVYHDARQAEVMTAQLRHYPVFSADSTATKPNRPHLYWRWRVNRFLYKWLGYCLHQGHRFTERP